MIEYSELTVLVRQIANGSMAISALFVIAVFVHFIWRSWPYTKYNVAVKAAVAILVLTIGHLIRSVSSWLEFLWIDLNWDVSTWLIKSWSWFLISAVLVLIGKSLMLLNFAPWRHRKVITITAVVTAVAFPILLAILT